MNNSEITAAVVELVGWLQTDDLDSLVASINGMRFAIHEKSPFKQEPVDFVEWVKNTSVYANDYNPNTVAPPEMELLRLSIQADGYTQPIVTMPDADGAGMREVIDGFHRHRVGKDCADIRERVRGYLPTVRINEERYDKADRMAATIRHNRARGKHRVDAMSDIVIELKRRNWSDNKIARVNGANSGALYISETGNMTGYNKITKPDGHTWQSFCNLLLQSLPTKTREHYLTRFRSFLKGWRTRGYATIPDEAPKVLEDKQWAPSWRRLCKVLLRNDHWCKGLGMTQPKSEAYGKYLRMKKCSK